MNTTKHIAELRVPLYLLYTILWHELTITTTSSTATTTTVMSTFTASYSCPGSSYCMTFKWSTVLTNMTHYHLLPIYKEKQTNYNRILPSSILPPPFTHTTTTLHALSNTIQELSVEVLRRSLAVSAARVYSYPTISNHKKKQKRCHYVFVVILCVCV